MNHSPHSARLCRTLSWMAMMFGAMAGTLNAQSTGSIEGDVRTQDGAPVVAIDIIDAASGIATRTRDDGSFSLRNVPAGERTVVARGMGFRPSTTSVVVTSSRASRVVIVLEIDPVGLSDVTIRADRITYREPLSSSAARGGMKVIDAPMSVEIINDRRMRDQAANRLDEMFSYMGGISQQGTRGQGFLLRGFSLDQEFSAYLINGMNGAIWRQHDPPSAIIDRVEYLKGPASIVFGVGQPGGTINIITKQPSIRAEQSIEVRHETYASDISPAAARNGFSITSDFTGPLTEDNTLLYRLALSHTRSESFRDDVSDGSVAILPSIAWRPAEGTSASLQLELLADRGSFDEYLVAPKGDLSLVPAITTRLGEPTDSYRESGIAASASLDHAFSDAFNLRVQARHASRSDGRRLFQHRAILNDSMLARSYRDQENSRRYSFLDAYMQSRVEFLSMTHTIITGVSGGLESVHFDRLSLTADPSLNINIYAPVHNASIPKAKPGTNRFWSNTFGSVYLEDRMAIGSMLDVIVGARFDVASIDHEERSKELTFSKTDAAASPRVAVVVRPVEGVSAYASLSTSFAPTDAEKENAEGTIDFDPERGEQYEVGVKTDVFDGRLSGSIALFQITQRNTLCQAEGKNPNGNSIYQQVGRMRSQGAELDLNVTPFTEWQMTGTLSYTDARIIEDKDPALVDARATHVPNVAASFWSNYRVAEGTLAGFGLGLGVVHTGERPTTLPSATGTTLVLPAYTRLDGSLFYETGNVRVAVNVPNVLDTRYWASGESLRLVPGAPRSVRTTITITH